LVQKQHPLKATLDDITTDDGTKLTFNGQTTIWAKTRLAAERLQLGGVMIWEVGQDCRMVAVLH
jgi:GH18 family chitinase